jgi:hypothetical protein
MFYRSICGKILNFQLRNRLLVFVRVWNTENCSDDRTLDPDGWTREPQSCGKSKPTIKEEILYSAMNKNKEHFTRGATFILYTTGSRFDGCMLVRKPFRTNSCYLVWEICFAKWKGKVILLCPSTRYVTRRPLRPLGRTYGTHWMGGWVDSRNSGRFGEQRNLLPPSGIDGLFISYTWM